VVETSMIGSSTELSHAAPLQFELVLNNRSQVDRHLPARSIVSNFDTSFASEPLRSLARRQRRSHVVVMEQIGVPKMAETRTDPIIASATAADHDAHSPSLNDGASKPLSKSAMKKAAKAERYAASKLERRAKEKEAKKEKKRLNAEKRAAGELEENEEEEENKRRKKRVRLQFGGNVIIDLGFDKLMSEKVGGV
jgi:hypothetical protein